MITPVAGKALKALVPEMAVTVQPSRCVRQRCSHNACTKCMDVCPTNAVFWDESGIGVNPENCTQCLACLAVCPTAALVSPELSLLHLLSDLASHPLPVLGCHGRPETQAHSRLPCLGLMAHPEFMVLCALVFPEGLQINLTACEDCPNRHILPGIGNTYTFMNELITNNAVQLILQKIDLNFLAPSFSRRQLFSVFRERSARTTATIIGRLQESDEQQSYGEKQVPTVRSMLLKVLNSVPGEYRQTIASQLFGNIVFTSNCIRAERCIGVCPTGAIQPSKNETDHPVFHQNLCVSCNSCIAFCRNQGVMDPSA